MAPEPDIPVALASRIWDRLLSTSATAGATWIAAASRSLRADETKAISPAASSPAAGADGAGEGGFDRGARSNAAKTFGVGAGTRGLAKTAKTLGKRRGSRAVRRSLTSSGLSGKANRHVRSGLAGRRQHAWVVPRQAVRFSQSGQRGRGVRGAAADPGRGRQMLHQTEAAEGQVGDPSGERARRSQDEVLFRRPSLVSGRSLDIEVEAAPSGSYPSQSPISAKATRLSISCSPSDRRARTLRLRLIFAGAWNQRIDGQPPVFAFSASFGAAGALVVTSGRPNSNLLQDRGQVLGVPDSCRARGSTGSEPPCAG